MDEYVQFYIHWYSPYNSLAWDRGCRWDSPGTSPDTCTTATGFHRVRLKQKLLQYLPYAPTHCSRNKVKSIVNTDITYIAANAWQHGSRYSWYKLQVQACSWTFIIWTFCHSGCLFQSSGCTCSLPRGSKKSGPWTSALIWSIFLSWSTNFCTLPIIWHCFATLSRASKSPCLRVNSRLFTIHWRASLARRTRCSWHRIQRASRSSIIVIVRLTNKIELRPSRLPAAVYLNRRPR
jgi:hypothetical protein